jgi:hypothetical protein
MSAWKDVIKIPIKIDIKNLINFINIYKMVLDDEKTGPEEKGDEGAPIPKKVAKIKAAAKKKNRPDAPAGCLVRASLHNKKISTVVRSECAWYYYLWKIC